MQMEGTIIRCRFFRAECPVEVPEAVLRLSELETPYQKKGFETDQSQMKLFFSLRRLQSSEDPSQGGSGRSGGESMEVASLGVRAGVLGAVAELGLEPGSSGGGLGTLHSILATALGSFCLKKPFGLKAPQEWGVSSEALVSHRGEAQECRGTVVAPLGVPGGF